MAVIPPPPPNVSIAPKLLVPVGIIIGIGLPLYVARMYTRVRMNRKLERDDYAITIAEICAIIGYALVAVSCKYGLGRHSVYVSPEDSSNALFYFFMQAIVWYLGMASMRISVAFLLLRMQRSTTWKRILWLLIWIQVCVAATATIFLLTFCVPLHAQWKPDPSAKCKSEYASHVFAYVYIVFGITSDLSLSLMPLPFIWQLRRSRFERIVVGALMCLGLVATFAAIQRLVDMAYQHFTGDVMHDIIIPNIWCMLEEVIGITAVSIPYLKAPAERMLQRLGISFAPYNHQPSLNEVHISSVRNHTVEGALESGDKYSNPGSLKEGKAEFELSQSSQTASRSQ